jgi:hypothetical protein
MITCINTILHYDNSPLLPISTNLSLPLDITLVISLSRSTWEDRTVTLASYSILLIGLCHKKSIVNFGVECCPPPPNLNAPSKTQLFLPSPRFISCFSPIHFRVLYVIMSCHCVIHPSTVQLIHFILSCQSVMSICHVILSYISLQT